MSLERFITAQGSSESGFITALTELQAGRKTSHWIWYLFPQLVSLGRSSTAQYYGIKDTSEAADYLREITLRMNLLRLLEVVVEKLTAGSPIVDLMGGVTDSQKLLSCTTLFEHVAQDLSVREPSLDLNRIAGLCGEIIRLAESQGFTRCSITLREMAQPN